MVRSCFYPAEDEHFSSFICRQYLLSGDGWSLKAHNGCFLAYESNYAPRFVPEKGRFQEFVAISKMTHERFLDNHTLFPLLAIYHGEREVVGPKPLNEFISPNSLNFCPSCMSEAMKENGWAYIKRYWAVPGVMACIEHRKELINVSAVNCGCFSIDGARWFQNLLYGVCSECGSRLWNANQKDCCDEDLFYAKVIQSAITSWHYSYQAKNNKKLYGSEQSEKSMFSFRTSRVLYVLQRLQELKGILAYPDSRTGVKELSTMEKRLISTVCYRIEGKWEELRENLKVGSMPIGDEPSASDMTPEIHGQYLDFWVEKNGALKPHLLTLLCDRQLRAVDMDKIKPALAQRLRRMEMAETRELRLRKMVEKIRAGKKQVCEPVLFTSPLE